MRDLDARKPEADMAEELADTIHPSDLEAHDPWWHKDCHLCGAHADDPCDCFDMEGPGRNG